MKQLLLEICTQNNSPESILKYKKTLEKLVIERAKELRIPLKDINIYTTSKRIAIISSYYQDIQISEYMEIKGPAKDICYDDEGNPTYIYKKFIHQKGNNNLRLTTKETCGKEYIYLSGKKQCKPIKDIFPNFIVKILNSVNIWKNIRNILVIFDGEVLSVNHKDFSSKEFTLFLDEKVEVHNIDHYLKLMNEQGVLLKSNQREETIKHQIKKIENSIKSKAFFAKMDIITGLSEHPKIYLSHLSQSITLPDDILKFFLSTNPEVVLFKKGDKISKNIALILDRKVAEISVINYTKSVEVKLLQIQKVYNDEMDNHFIKDTHSLKNIVFLEDLGTMYDKVQRVKHIAGKISDLLSIGEPITTYTKRAAELSKNDLTNPLVALYPKLHGIVGKNYALKWGESQEVAQAIEEYILPIKYQPKLPQTMAGSILSIADKIDTIVGLFSVGIYPKGNDDIYKLKAKTDGIIRIIEKTQMDISLKRITNLAINLYESYHILKQKDKDKLLKDILKFFNMRIKHYLEEQDFDSHIVDALVANGSTNITLISGKGDFLHGIIENTELKDTVVVFNRLKNLIGSNPMNEIEIEFLTEDIEIKLYENFLYHKKNYYDKIDTGDFESAFYELHSLNYCLEKFLNNIYVYTTDEAIRLNRLNILTNIYDLFLDFCDFSKFKNRVVNK
ncbi:glycine--tRNA ligase subunit beta [Alkalicella caledoniensis]|uniref:glycine--tRNA ligase n=1 Tax=Alkalicella caledoniensis TaxID=2731377 RepID=A0A7G9W4D5_ALKCA|nr:glycine--tRNA ligase subunit beta [Alkalicella caledoniensis]QNO13547.1 glycine--tRNA ligase subunit beta [Alkalicella caledoniensis]